jgi:predicted transposase/invertase (TIGR01784 family)
MTENTYKDNNLNNPHDKFFKAAFGIKAIAQACLEEFINKDLLNKLDLDSLIIESNSYITDELSEFYADLVWRCTFKKSPNQMLVSFLFEHKSYKPLHPHFQLLDYQRNAWKNQLAANQELVPIVPIILYHGKEAWNKMPFEHYFGAVDAEILHFLPRFDYFLINLQDYPDEVLKTFQSILLKKTLLAFKHYFDKNYIKTHIVELWLIGYGDRKSEQTGWFIRAFGVYLSAISGVSRQQVIQEVIQSDNNLKSEAMSIVDEFIHEGKKIGKIEGKIEGIKEGIEIGKKMSIYDAYLNGHSIESIAQFFKLPADKIIQIVEEMKKLGY